MITGNNTSEARFHVSLNCCSVIIPSLVGKFSEGARMQKDVEDIAQTVINGFGVAGMAIGIVKSGEIYAKGFGVKDFETREPVTANSLFHLASISKTFVATAVM